MVNISFSIRLEIRKFSSKFNLLYASVFSLSQPYLIFFATKSLSMRKNLSTLSNEMSFETIFPDLKFCGDNAAMIAWAGIQRFKQNMVDDLNISAKSRWPLDKSAPYMKGPGLKL